MALAFIFLKEQKTPGGSNRAIIIGFVCGGYGPQPEPYYIYRHYL
jgi:hypothetical protein